MTITNMKKKSNSKAKFVHPTSIKSPTSLKDSPSSSSPKSKSKKKNPKILKPKLPTPSPSMEDHSTSQSDNDAHSSEEKQVGVTKNTKRKTLSITLQEEQIDDQDEQADSEGEEAEEGEQAGEEELVNEGDNDSTLKNSGFIQSWGIDIEWCKSSKFTTLLDLIEFQNWSYLLGDCSTSSISISAMDDFVSNFEALENMCLSAVHNKLVKFDADFLANLFKTPNKGYDYYDKGKHVSILVKENVGNDEIVKYFGGKNGDTWVKVENLSAMGKLLFTVVRKGILPRTEGRAKAGLLDLAYMYCLEHKIQINFPSLMIQHLCRCVPKKNKVGYDSLLTKVFESLGVKLKKQSLINSNPKYFLNSTTLGMLHLVIDDGKVYFKDKVPQKVVKDEGRKVMAMRNMPHIGSRKSRRLASKEVVLPDVISIDEAEFDVQNEKQPSLVPSGFAPYSVVEIRQLMQDVVEKMGSLLTAQNDFQALIVKRITKLEDETSTLRKECKDLHLTLKIHLGRMHTELQKDEGGNVVSSKSALPGEN